MVASLVFLKMLKKEEASASIAQMRLVPSTEYAGMSLVKACVRTLKDSGEHLDVGGITDIILSGGYETDISRKNLEASVGTTIRRAWKKGYLGRRKFGRSYKYRFLSKEERVQKESGPEDESSEATQELDGGVPE
ncbi:BlaI/MecI/CopY family transcriptional regulator [Nitrospinae bacterium AH_259_B05_G02_I21]|nr:BlaI/MecI/CopY family transcriptional regulator [Nitrospinae bacterium AH_259_B05_G02_I21]MDA2932184.1 BlaI/MecI/CopY family transcriptional regulator [Nitrospinae bacterium AH-259-F20]